ncbi:MAG TPA: hypothetical protein VJN44_18270, partial [Roseateles sp.]|nr:hypothetical protein [Roseateles sp.]
MSRPPAPPDAASQAPAPRRGAWRRNTLLAAGLSLPGLALLGGLALYWITSTERGAVWMLERIPGLQLEAPRGTLLGDFSSRRLSYRSGDFSVELQGLRWQGLSVAWVGSPRLWTRIGVEQLQVDRATLRWASASQDGAPPSVPQDLTLPLVLDLPRLQIGELRLPALSEQPLRELRGGLWLSEQLGGQHRIELQGLQWDRLRLAGQASLRTRGDLPLQAQLQLNQAAADADAGALPGWQASASLQGPLTKLQLQAHAALAAPGSAVDSQNLALSAVVQPFAAWPLADASFKAAHFDLASLHSSLPATRLSGQGRLETQGWDRPARLRAQLDNPLAGRWDRQRLPLQRLELDLEARPDRLGGIQDLAALQVHRLDALLGSPAQPGGRLTAQGQGLQLQARISALNSAALDQRLPPLLLGGGLELRGRAAGTGIAATLSARLEGHWQQNPATRRPLALQLQGHNEGARLRLEQLSLRSGNSRLNLQGHFEPAAAGWQAAFEATAKEFDPRLLWAGTPRSAWAGGQHSLDATLRAELSQGSGPWPRGQAKLAIAPSLLAGMALSGQASYQA